MKINRQKLLISLLLLVLTLLPPFAGVVDAELQHFTVLHSSDEHSSLMPVPHIDYLAGERDLATGGFARLATVIKDIRNSKRETPVLLFSSGDFIGGTPFSWLILNNCSPELAIMHHLGYNATTIGNHEFDYGSQGFADYLNRLQAQGKLLPIIVSNLLASESHDINKSGIRKNLLIPLENGLFAGVFALFGRGANRVAPEARPLHFADQQSTAHEQVKSLKEAGAQVIIALTHCGIAEDRELAAAVPGIHLILGGHDHLQFEQPEMVGNTMIMHSGYYTQNLSQLDLAWDTTTQMLKLCNQETSAPVLHAIDSSISEESETAAIIENYRQLLNEFIASFTGDALTDVAQIVARSEFELPRNQPFTESTTGNFVTDAMRIESEKILGEKVDFAVQANGVIRGALMSGQNKHNAGNITLFDLISISAMGTGPDRLPGYPLVSLYYTGAEIYRLLEIASILPQLWGDIYFLQFSGLRYTYDPERTFWIRRIPWLNLPWPACKSVLSVERLSERGETADKDIYTPLSADDNRLYHLVTTRYLATYLPMVGSRLPRLQLGVKNKQNQEIDLEQAIIREDDREFKVWQATVRYTASFAKGLDNLPIIPKRYRATEGRIKAGKGQWLWLWPLAAAITGLVLLFLLYIFRLRQSKSS